MLIKERQLTSLPKGHCLHNTQVFSDDDTLIVYDTRNDDSQIKTTGTVEMLNVQTGEEIIVYQVPYQNELRRHAKALCFCEACLTVTSSSLMDLTAEVV
jgi:hypothetical protein